MVSADNVNYDVLALIFAYLGNNDLVSVSLVSKSFKAGATSRLYRSICFRLDHMKKWPKIASPFATIIAHPGLGVHVRHWDIKAVPKLKGQPHPAFVSSCAESLALCPNLRSFSCTSDVPPFLPLLHTKERLTELKVHAALGTEQAQVLTRLQRLRSLALYQASWNVCHALPGWAPSLSHVLTHLTIANSRELNEGVLEALMMHLPTLRGLHIVGCFKIGHYALLRLVTYTPLLESLSFTTWENSASSSIPLFVWLPHLLHLSIDTRCSFPSHAVPTLYQSIFTALAACPLTSLTIKLSERLIVGDQLISQILDNHGATLTKFNAVNVSLTETGMEDVCMRCHNLEQLAVVVPVHELDPFAESLRSLFDLHTLIDIGDSHSTHGPRPTLTASDVRQLFECARRLQKVISGNRCWTCERTPIYDECFSDEDGYGMDPDGYEIKLKLERVRRRGGAAQHLGDGGLC